MASRMERYYQDTETEGRRSRKNKDLYRTIYDGPAYTNIEGVATIEKTNEIDISKIKEMLKSREDYKKQKEYRKLMYKELEPEKEPVPEVVEEDPEPHRNYDIRDILTKAKEENPDEVKSEHHSLNNTQYNILKNLRMKEKVNKEDYVDEEDPDIKKLINTITNTSMLNKMGDKELSLDLLDDLKSDTITSVSTLPSIHELMDEEEKDPTGELELDKSFFTSAYSFGDDDFDVDEDGNLKPKKKHTVLKVFITLFVLVILAGVGFFIYTQMK